MNSKTKSILLGLSLSVVVVVLVVLRVTGIFPPIEKKPELVDMIGGVQKAEKFHDNLITFEDVKFEDPEFAIFVQSADFQNMMKDRSFGMMISSQEFSKILPQLTEVNQVLDRAALDLQKFLSNSQNFKSYFGAQSFKSWAGMQELKSINLGSVTFRQIEQVVNNQPLKAFEAPSLQDVQKLVYNRDFQKIVLNTEMQKIYPMAQDFYAVCSQDFQKVFRTDFTVQTFQTLYSNQEFQKFFTDPQSFSYIASQEFRRQFMSQDFQRLMVSREFLKASGTDDPIREP
jgi:hypothetical protein